jgi:hypothetical protein
LQRRVGVTLAEGRACLLTRAMTTARFGMLFSLWEILWTMIISAWFGELHGTMPSPQYTQFILAHSVWGHLKALARALLQGSSLKQILCTCAQAAC